MRTPQLIISALSSKGKSEGEHTDQMAEVTHGSAASVSAQGQFVGYAHGRSGRVEPNLEPTLAQSQEFVGGKRQVAPSFKDTPGKFFGGAQTIGKVVRQ